MRWLALCQEASRAVEAELAARPTRSERGTVVGRGEGGDRTLAIDAAAERAVVAALEALAAEGFSFTLVSEELGVRRFGEPEAPWTVVVDPVDGSLNAKRGIPAYALSIAVADGSTLGDVVFGFVHDYGTGEEWVAERGAGAALGGATLGEVAPLDELEVVMLEGTEPRLVAPVAARLPASVQRVRCLGSLAVALCQLAAGRVDAILSLRPARAVDIAAAQLVVREAGFAVALPDVEQELLGAPLDLEGRSRLVAARDAAGCARIAAALSGASRA
jgi:myo-inositol-1(or 4)-monophosphatase